MRIGIIGTGNMADALGGRWAAAGHRVLFGGRSPERARALADRTGQSAGTLRDAAGFGDAVLLALPYDAVAGVLAALGADGGALRGRVLVDCTHAVGPGFRLTTGTGPGAARTIADATGARVVKAFNHLPDARCGGGSRPPSPKGRSPSRCAGTTRRPWRGSRPWSGTSAVCRCPWAGSTGPRTWRRRPRSSSASGTPATTRGRCCRPSRRSRPRTGAELRGPRPAPIVGG